MKKRVINEKKTLRIFLAAIIICFFAVLHVMNVVVISGSSMYPTLKDGEWYTSIPLRGEADLDRGDIVIIDSGRIVKARYVKRIVGIPGDDIVIKNEALYRNGIKYETYEPIQYAGFAENTITLMDDEYFVLGDNVNHSSDSRMFGIVKKVHIIGLLDSKLF